MVSRQSLRRGVGLFSAATLLILSGTLAAAAGGAGGEPSPSRPKRGPYVELIRQVLQEGPAAADRDVDPEKAAEEAAAKADILQGDAMLEARVWLEEYFAVQVDYDEHEVAEFKARLVEMSAAELRLFLMRFQRQRALLKQRHEASERLRTKGLTLHRLAVQREQTDRRFAASIHRYDHYRNYFVSSARVNPRRYRVVLPPLISSLSVARYAVHRAIFGRWW